MNPAQLIASSLAALPHPDGTPRNLAGYSGTLLPEGLREQVDRAAQDVGEAIVHLLDTNGWEIVPAGGAPDRSPGGDEAPPVAHLHCSLCDARILTLNLTTPSHCVTDGRVLIDALRQLAPECPHA